MENAAIRLSRIDKLFVDRDQIGTHEALAKRRDFYLTFLCGDDVVESRTLQAALLTAANIATRCFPGAQRVVLSEKLASAPLLLWPNLHLSIGEALAPFFPCGLDTGTFADGVGHTLVFGDVHACDAALRVTFDGWVAKIGPADEIERLPEREHGPLSGVLAAALAMSESFLAFADISVEARRRTIALSLWRPDLDASNPSALGIPMQFLPQSLWALGLGHLGNAYLWALATLPYPDPSKVTLYLNDFDKVEAENIETGLLFGKADVGRLKTRVVSTWLEKLGFDTRLIERRFDGAFRRSEDEPGLGLCGFDSNSARRALCSAEFRRVIECGLGGTAANFDTFSMHTLPNPRAPEELWPDLSPGEEAKRTKERNRIARENPVYQALSGDECGRFELAGKSVAVSFVGTAAAAFVLAEVIRLFHDGPNYTDAKISLAAPDSRSVRANGVYASSDTAGLGFVRVDENRER